MTKTDRFESDFLDGFLRNGSIATNILVGSGKPLSAGSGAGSTNLYLNLHTAGVAETVSNLNEVASEATYTGYAALTIARAASEWDALGSGLYANGNVTNFTFATNTGSAQRVTHWSLSHSNGDLYYTGPLSSGDPQPFTCDDTGTNAKTNACVTVAHGFSSNDEIILLALPNVTFPTGVSSNSVYFVTFSNLSGESTITGISNDYFRIASNASGWVPGNILNIASGAGLVAAMNSQNIQNNNIPRFTSNQLRITED